jgi:thymidine kinase
MAKLHFFYSVMNAGKSTALLQAAHNYETKGWNVLCFTSALDIRDKVGYISSRVGIKREAVAMTSDSYFSNHVSPFELGRKRTVWFVDEVQFLDSEQIDELAQIVDHFKIPVLCYGLKNNSNGELFGPAIIRLLALADQIKELKTVCHCGAKATQILRRRNGVATITSDIVEVGDSEYESVCRTHWKEAFYEH